MRDVSRVVRLDHWCPNAFSSGPTAEPRARGRPRHRRPPCRHRLCKSSSCRWRGRASFAPPPPARRSGREGWHGPAAGRCVRQDRASSRWRRSPRVGRYGFTVLTRMRLQRLQRRPIASVRGRVLGCRSVDILGVAPMPDGGVSRSTAARVLAFVNNELEPDVADIERHDPTSIGRVFTDRDLHRSWTPA